VGVPLVMEEILLVLDHILEFNNLRQIWKHKYITLSKKHIVPFSEHSRLSLKL